MKVAIQGIKGSYHHQVAIEFFSGDIEIDECMSFDALVESLIEDKSDYGVMAIENSIAGSIIPNYSLIDKYGLSIIGEHYININHNLMVYPGVKLNDVKFISSHPMALLQCKDFIKNSKKTIVEDRDTADVAKRIIENQTIVATNFDIFSDFLRFWTKNMIQALSCFRKVATCDGANVVTRLPCVRRSTCMFTANNNWSLNAKQCKGLVRLWLHAYRAYA